MTDERLMAFADGMADPEESAIIETAIAEDADLAQRVAMFRQTAARLSDLAAAKTPVVPSEIEMRLRALASQSEADVPPPVVDLAQHREKRSLFRGGSGWHQLPLAASLFIAIGAAGTYFAMSVGPSETAVDLQVAGLTHPSIKTALDSLPSGTRQATPSGGEVEVIASFTNSDGEFCREIELDHPDRRTIVSVACHTGQEWDVRLAIAAAPVLETGYAPASSLETLDAYLTATHASAPLDQEAEQLELNSLKD